MSDYLPKTEGELKDFALNFSTLITAAPATYGLVAGDAVQIAAVADDYAGKYELAVNPVTRTVASLAEKNEAKASLLPVLRGYAMQVKNNQAVSTAAKLNLGLRAEDGIATPVPTPATFPLLHFVAATPLQHELRYADSACPDRRSKPAGAIGMQLFCHVGEAPPANPLSSRFQAFVTRQPFKMGFQAEDVGRRAYYYGRWQTRTGRFGPWSEMISHMVG